MNKNQGDWQLLLCEEDGAGTRIDSFVAAATGLSRTRVQSLISEGLVKCNGATARANLKLTTGDKIEYHVPAPREIALRPEAIPLKILFQDEYLAVIEKPAGLVVHPAAGNWSGTLVNALLHHLETLASSKGIGGELRPGIVHRMDKNTSGVLVVTKNDEGHQFLSEQFKTHSLERRYHALAWGKIGEGGEWTGPIGRDPKERKRMAVVEGGKRALTKFKRLRGFGTHLSLFEAELFTGRTHQIRVHAAAAGLPLVGDALYVSSQRALKKKWEEEKKSLRRWPRALELVGKLEENQRQFLHAAYLAFDHPTKGRLEFTSPLPPDLADLLTELESCFPR